MGETIRLKCGTCGREIDYPGKKWNKYGVSGNGVYCKVCDEKNDDGWFHELSYYESESEEDNDEDSYDNVDDEEEEEDDEEGESPDEVYERPVPMIDNEHNDSTRDPTQKEPTDFMKKTKFDWWDKMNKISFYTGIGMLVAPILITGIVAFVIALINSGINLVVDLFMSALHFI